MCKSQQVINFEVRLLEIRVVALLSLLGWAPQIIGSSQRRQTGWRVTGHCGELRGPVDVKLQLGGMEESLGLYEAYMENPGFLDMHYRVTCRTGRRTMERRASPHTRIAALAWRAGPEEKSPSNGGEASTVCLLTATQHENPEYTPEEQYIQERVWAASL